MSYANVGKRWSPSSFPAYLAGLRRPAWARSVTVHYTAAPSLAQRPSGFTAQHIENIRDYYKRKYGWNRGPHFFTDDDDIFGMTPPTVAGIHAVSFNASSLGIEALGAYDSEDPKSGRGLAVMLTTASCARAQLDWLGLAPSRQTVLFHRFDPKTTKTCPGTKVVHDWFLELVIAARPGVPVATAESDAGDFASQEMVPAISYISGKTGRSGRDLAAILRREGALYYLGEQWLEGAYYDVDKKATMVPRAEAEEAVEVLNRPIAIPTESVPVVATMAARFGLSYAAAAKSLVYRDGSFFWSGNLIVGASYDRTRQTTMAAAAELSKLPR